MPDEDITVEGSIADGKGDKHGAKLTLTKGKKDDNKKRREADKIKITASDLADKFLIMLASGKIDKTELKWIAPEKNAYGGWSGRMKGFGLQVHCERRKLKGGKEDPTDDPPYIVIEIPEEDREKAKNAGFPVPEPLKFKFKGDTEKEQHAQQDKINDYFKDPELPATVFF